MPTASKLHIVVVDDQLTMRSLVRTGLQQIGISNSRDFPGAAEAWTNIQTNLTHVVISDYNMPGMDGLAFLRAMRANPAMNNIAFILLTGRADKELVARAVQFGANNYLVKPFTVATLKQKIEQVVGPLS